MLPAKHQVRIKTLLHHQQSNPKISSGQSIFGNYIFRGLANSTIGFLRRNLRHCPLPCRKNANLALFRSKLEYGSVVWDPYIKSDIDRLERVQRSAARFITGDYKSRHEGCVTNMLDDLDHPSLEERRRQQRLTFLYKVVKGHAIIIDHYLRAQNSKRTIRVKQNEDFVKKNIVERSICNNNQCFKQLPAETEQFRNLSSSEQHTTGIF